MKKTLIALVVAATGFTGMAQAALVTIPIHYRVDFASSTVTSQIGLSTGSLFGGSATYDDATTPGLLDDYTVTALTLNFGNFTFTAASDTSGFGAGIAPSTTGGLPSLFFQTGFTLNGGSGNGDYLLVFDGTSGRVTPSGNTFDYVVTASAVPLPAALPLLLAGLGAMGFVGRRRAAVTVNPAAGFSRAV